MTPADASRLLSNVERIPFSSCWYWTAGLDAAGYGRIGIDGVNQKASRVSYRLHRGEFDQQLHVLHTCDTPACINPDHLYLGTNNDNVLDRLAKERGLPRSLVSIRGSQMHLATQQDTQQRPCKQCGLPFTPRRAWADFCKTKCRNDFHGRQARIEAIMGRGLSMFVALGRIAQTDCYGAATDADGRPCPHCIATTAIKDLKAP